MSTILVVDDEPDVLLTVRLTLQIAGYDVIEAETGTKALERAWEMPDAIILDLRLPDMDGRGVLAALKAEPALERIPVVCLSAHSDARTKQHTLELGAHAYVNKPFDVAVLRNTIASALGAVQRT